jgi:8-oxo-dGTP pyrophosphatase MutT (NUDIX family)
MPQAIDIFGSMHKVNESSLIFRPTAYAIFIKDNKILVLDTKSTGKFQMAGGGIEYNETLEEGLRREVKEELGIDIKIDRFLFFSESIFFNRPEVWDCYRYFFLCSSNDYTFLSNDKIMDEEAINPQWIPIQNLNEQNFQYSQLEILSVIYKLPK